MGACWSLETHPAAAPTGLQAAAVVESPGTTSPPPPAAVRGASNAGSGSRGLAPLAEAMRSYLPASATQKMQAPDEPGRLAAVQALELIGVAPKPEFTSITELVRQMFDCPVGVVTLIEEVSAGQHFPRNVQQGMAMGAVGLAAAGVRPLPTRCPPDPCRA